LNQDSLSRPGIAAPGRCFAQRRRAAGKTRRIPHASETPTHVFYREEKKPKVSRRAAVMPRGLKKPHSSAFPSTSVGGEPLPGADRDVSRRKRAVSVGSGPGGLRYIKKRCAADRGYRETPSEINMRSAAFFRRHRSPSIPSRTGALCAASQFLVFQPET